MKRSVRVFISGTVQGVFFRSFVKENADRLGIKGYVRNLPDGRVEAWLEGNSEAVEKMIDLCKQGPKFAKVDKVETKEEHFQGFQEFKILRI